MTGGRHPPKSAASCYVPIGEGLQREMITFTVKQFRRHTLPVVSSCSAPSLSKFNRSRSRARMISLRASTPISCKSLLSHMSWPGFGGGAGECGVRVEGGGDADVCIIAKMSSWRTDQSILGELFNTETIQKYIIPTQSRSR